jgi:hypothetical protein
VISLLYLFNAVFARPDFSKTLSALTDQIMIRPWAGIVAALFLLMFLNWMLETIKWHMLMQLVHPTTWLQSISGVLSGITISMFTPNRSGEFAGRALHADPGFRIQAALASLVGSTNQLLITILAGSTGLIFTIDDQTGDKYWLYLTAVLVISVAMIVSVYMYFNLPSVTRISERVAKSRKVRMYLEVFGLYSRKDLLHITLFSAGRYFLFTCQFIMIIDWFGIQLPVVEGFRLISLIFLVTTFVPTFAVSELTVRGSVALYFLSPYTLDATAVIASTTILWLVNLVIPSLPGALSFLLLKWQNSQK